jgi:hypothetical protein
VQAHEVPFPRHAGLKKEFDLKALSIGRQAAAASLRPHVLVTLSPQHRSINITLTATITGSPRTGFSGWTQARKTAPENAACERPQPVMI